jgi:hypothetical protein
MNPSVQTSSRSKTIGPGHFARTPRDFASRHVVLHSLGMERDTFRLANVGTAGAGDILALVDAMRDTLSEMDAPPSYAS